MVEDRVRKIADALNSGTSGRLLIDAPIMTDVWVGYSRVNRDAPIALLMTPAATATAAGMAAALAAALPEAQIVHVPGLVRAKLTLAELVNQALPRTRWWQELARLDERRRTLALNGMRQLIDAFEDVAISLPAVDTEAPLSTDLIDRIAPERRFELAARAPVMLSGPEAEGAEAGAAPARLSPVLVVDAGDANRTIKADAAARLFQPSHARLRWAVIDSGISARCGAFGIPAEAPDPLTPEVLATSRIDAVFDFAGLADKLAQAQAHPAALTALIAQDPLTDKAQARALSAALHRRIGAGRDADWEMLEPVLRIPVDTEPPTDAFGQPVSHGTAVASLLAADGRAGGILGVAPDIRLLDIRVASQMDEPAGIGVNEFDLIAALKFVRYLNGRSETPYVHGVNLSLQTPHDVRNYACGSTPICVEVNRAVESGIVVVTAAGNLGYRTIEDSEGVIAPHYFGMTITDPGNAEEAVTVGSTHRRDPHRYGVSFFSGRGPTGDGRHKPDIVAPGEKITVLTARGGVVEDQDGTSYAAPMVSGAAAMLMARYPELIGRPRMVKRILMETATDLGRTREFQGAGLLDVLRAMQWGGGR